MKKVAIFDFNGTLIDDTREWWQCVLEIFRYAGFTGNVPTIEEFLRRLDATKNLFDTYRILGVTTEKQEINAVYYATYTKLASGIVISQPTISAIQALKNAGVVCAIVSWNLRSLLLQTLEQAGIRGYFKYVTAEAHDKTAAIKDIRWAEDVMPGNCYYIGDMPGDIDSSQRAGVKSIVLLHQLIPERLIDEKQPDYKIRHLGELPKIIIG